MEKKAKNMKELLTDIICHRFTQFYTVLHKFTQFYNESIRKMVIGFGSLFNDILVEREQSDGTNKETIRVPLSYGPKEKFLRRLQESSSISDAAHTQISLPRLGFDITGIAYDPQRKGNKLRKTHAISLECYTVI